MKQPLYTIDELQFEVCKSIALFIGHKSANDLANNPVLHGRSKHI